MIVLDEILGTSNQRTEWRKERRDETWTPEDEWRNKWMKEEMKEEQTEMN